MTLKIIGAGMGRTGTKSTKLALEVLGFGPCHHMHELLSHPETIQVWQGVAADNVHDWNEVLHGYRSQVDWPGAFFWRALIAYYSDAKVILTVRDPDEWYDSMTQTIMRGFQSRDGAPNPVRREQLRFAHNLVSEQLFQGNLDDPIFAKELFMRHNQDVIDTVPPEKLLVVNVKDGWQPFCQFLDVPIPDEPFPSENTTEAFLRGLRRS